MNPAKLEAPTATVARELARLQAEVDATSAVLSRLLQDVAQAESRVDTSETARLLAANEQLVVTAVRAQTEAETAERTLSEVSRAAALDALTELPNRALLLDRFGVAIANAMRHRTRLALLFLDLNNFKQINDTFGHAVGDLVLKRAAHCLASSVRAGDTVSRHGGDEFLVLLAEVAHASDAVLVADKMIAALGAPTRIGEQIIRLTVSIGIGIYPDDGEDAVTLIERADAAMYRAKKHGIGSFVFHGEHSVSEQTLRLPALVLQTPPPTQQERALAESERRQAQLREANEQLIIAALSAKGLQDAAELAQRQQKDLLVAMAHEMRDPSKSQRDVSRFASRLLAATHVGDSWPAHQRPIAALGTLIAAAIEGCRPSMDARLQQLDTQVPAGALKVQGEPARVQQILENLLDNASKYTPNGGRIGLSVVVEADTVAITISDNGIGMTAEALSRVFQPFMQDARTIEFKGADAGVGLRIARELVEAQGGTIVASSAGRELGSQFVVTLLRAQPFATSR